jgi:hypothetical protein
LNLKTFLKYHFTAALVIITVIAQAQDPNEKGNLTNYYYQRLHFGFALGINRANFMIQPAGNFARFDSLKTIVPVAKSGFNLGIVSDLMLHKYITVRFLPNLSFAGRQLDYYLVGKKDSIVKSKMVESVFINFPVDFKLRSKRVKNFGAYLLAGGGYSLDLASKRKVDNDGVSINDQIIKVKRDDFFYEGGAGAEFYLQYFKFAIEFKLSMGLRNMLVRDNTIFSSSLDKLKTKILTISITFEG